MQWGGRIELVVHPPADGRGRGQSPDLIDP